MVTRDSSSRDLRLLLVDDDQERASVVEAGLVESGFKVLACIPTGGGLLFQMERLSPDIVLISLDSPDRDVLESLAIVSSESPRPVVMFSGAEDQDFVADAIRSGVTAYQAEGINPSRARAAISVASAHFSTYRGLQDELDKTRQQLSDRRLIDRARGLIMQAQDVSEEDAFKALRKLAMDRQCSVGEAAKDVIAILERGRARRT